MNVVDPFLPKNSPVVWSVVRKTFLSFGVTDVSLQLNKPRAHVSPIKTFEKITSGMMSSCPLIISSAFMKNCLGILCDLL